MNTENRVSPQAPEIEEAIIGACLIEQGAIPLVADKLRPEMFYVLRHQYPSFVVIEAFCQISFV